MSNELSPQNTQDKSSDRQQYFPADQTPRREGGDDSLAEASPTDPRNDEKVIVNEQREQKIVNAPSQTEANNSERINNDEETI